MPLIDVSGPVGEPVTSAEIKASARIDGAEFDSHLAIIIPALRRQAEARTHRKIMTQTVRLVLDAFPSGEIDLTLPDVTAIVSVKYLDVAGVEQTMANTAYSMIDVGAKTLPTFLAPAHGTTWPDTYDAANAVKVEFTVGAASAAAVPEDIKLWIIAHACQVLRLPEGITSGTLAPLPFVDHLLDAYKVWRA